MRKFLTILLALVTILSVCTMFACKKDKKPELTEITYLSGLPATVTQGETPDYSALKITAKYSDGKTETVDYDKDSFTVEFDSSAVKQDAKVTITYGGKSCTATINVVAVIKTVDEISLVSGITGSVTQGSRPDFSTVVIKVKYSDGSEKEVAYNETDFVMTYDESAYGEAVEVTITYGGKTCTTTMTVIKYEITKVELPAFAATYNSAKASTSEFKIKPTSYYVGTMNEFMFVPRATAFVNDSTGKPQRIELNKSGDLEYVARVFRLKDGATVEIAPSEGYYEYDGARSAFTFTQKAAGESYILSVRPKLLYEDQLEEAESYTVEFSITVKDGYYNVYSVLDLFAMDNRAAKGDDSREAVAVKRFTEEKGFTVDTLAVKGLALQGNIDVTAADLPAEFFWTKEEVGDRDALVGSLKDYTYVFGRNLGGAEQFAIEGNFFNISAEKMPLVLVQGQTTPGNQKPDEVVSHAKLFRINGLSSKNNSGNTEHFEMNNMTLTGNLNRQETDKSGGFILVEFSGTKATMNNCIARRWYITAFSSLTSEDRFVTVNDCIMQDDYNCIFYIYGGIIQLNNTIANGAGGPVFLADHVKSGEKDGRTGSNGWSSDIRLDDYSAQNVYSYVTGNEGWFKQMNANSYAAQILAMDALFNVGGRTYVVKGESDKKLLNIVAIYKEGGAESADGLFSKVIEGKGTFGKSYFAMNDSSINAFMSISVGENLTIANSGMPVFYGSSMNTIFAYPEQSNGDGSPMFISPAGSATDISSVQALPIFKDNGSFINMLIGNPGDPGRIGIVLGSFGPLSK